MEDKELKNQIQSCIDLLNLAIQKEPKSLDYFEMIDWMQNCIKCLQFYFDNEYKLEENPKLKADIINVICLIYAFVYDGDDNALIELYIKFESVYTLKQMGEGLKYAANLFRKEAEKWNNSSVEPLKDERKVNEDILKDENGNLKSLQKVLSELSSKWNAIAE